MLDRRWRYFLAHFFWAKLPRDVQFFISRWHAAFYKKTWSRFLIRPYSALQYRSRLDLARFVPASGSPTYLSFQDFFTRRLASVPQPIREYVWPCDGMLCDLSRIGDDETVLIKGERRAVRTIFGSMGADLPVDYFFTNVFLHNRDYHRIHAPVSGRVVTIEKIPGELRFLRPWAYLDGPSIPALTNERIGVRLDGDDGKRTWLSIIGGPGVATIELAPGVAVGSYVRVGAELAAFHLGSTCCLVSERRPTARLGEHVRVGERL